jgi:SagB-type dehydrogenase family enzyme
MSGRDPAPLRRYHDATKHSFASIRQNPHTLDWDNMPLPFKVYTGLEPITLPRDFATSTRPVLAALADAGVAAGGGPPLDRATLAHLLYFAAGVLHRKPYPGGEIFFRAAACTGALYHIDLYLVCGPLPDLEAGVYHFGPHDFALRRLRAGDYRATLVEATANEPAVSAAPAILICTSTFWRNAWKYQARAYRHCFWDSGTLLANLLAVAAARDLPAHVVLGFVDDTVNRLLDLDGEREVALSLVALGHGHPPSTPPPPIGPLGLDTLPLSKREIDYPLIREAHAAGSLGSPEEVAAWRALRPPRPPTVATDDLVLLPRLPPSAVGEAVETVILRRGSTRHFSREPTGIDRVGTILHTMTRGIPSDCLAADAPLTDPYLIANAVEGLAQGAYVFAREREGLALLQAGDFRRDAGYLDLGQALAADAAINVYWLTDLDQVLAHLGPRGYRAAQLEAAIEGGKAYLAAYALDLGATGLTFFDDAVTTFFSPHAAGKDVMFLVAVGRPAPRAR